MCIYIKYFQISTVLTCLQNISLNKLIQFETKRKQFEPNGANLSQHEANLGQLEPISSQFGRTWAIMKASWESMWSQVDTKN